MEHPILCLRGGGADLKRKAARKRKFSHLQEPSSANELNGGVRDDGADSEPRSRKKKSKAENKNGSPGVSPRTEVQHGRDEGDNDQAASTIEVAVPNKSQRFICFVGRLDRYTGDSMPALYADHG